MGTQTLGTLEDEDEMEVTEETEMDQDFVPPTSRRESRSRTRGSRININPLLFAHSERRGEAFQSGQQQTPRIFTTLNPPALFFFFLPSIERHVFLQRAILFKIMSVK